jgi:hypothetical protein
VGPGKEGETPREGKAHEGHGSRIGLTHRPGERTLAGSKALKWGLLTMGLCRQYAARCPGHEPWNVPEVGQDGTGTGRRDNHRRATASERACGSAGGMNPGG